MRKILSVVLATSMVLSLAACSGTSSSTTAPATTSVSAGGSTETVSTTSADLSDKEIVVILKNLTSPFFISVKEGAEQAGKDYGVKVNVLAPVGQEGAGNEEQSQMAEQAIAQQVSCVVMCPVDSQGIVPAVKKIHDAGIPIVNLNTKIGGDEVLWDTFVAIENYDVGYSVADALCKGIGEKGKIMIIEGTAGAQTSIDRVSGANDAIKQYPDIELVASQSANYNRADAMNVAQNLLQSNPDVNAIFACNDEMACGVVEAIDAAGKNGVLVGGVDANSDALQAIEAGTMYVTCNSQPVKQGYGAVEAAAKILKGEKVDEFYKTESMLVNKDNVDEFIK